MRQLPMRSSMVTKRAYRTARYGEQVGIGPPPPEGGLASEGYVFRQHEAETTADSHIDLVFTDVLGRELAVVRR